MSVIRFYQALIMLALFFVNAVGAASICKEDSSDPACNPNSLDFDPNYEYGYYRADNTISNSDYENFYYIADNRTFTPENGSRTNNETGEDKARPFFGHLGLVLNVPKLDLNLDFVLDFNGTVGSEVGDKIDAELSSPMSNKTMKFSLEYLALDESGNVFRFIPAAADDSNTTTIFPTPTTESSKNSTFPDIGMVCFKLPPDLLEYK